MKTGEVKKSLKNKPEGPGGPGRLGPPGGVKGQHPCGFLLVSLLNVQPTAESRIKTVLLCIFPKNCALSKFWLYTWEIIITHSLYEYDNKTHVCLIA